MANEKRLINVWKLVIDLAKLEKSGQYDHENVLAVIASQQTEDAVEVVHGRFVDAECTNCRWFGNIVETRYYNYCPNCGAKMDGDGNG